jgi:hypothetical protein
MLYNSKIYKKAVCIKTDTISPRSATSADADLVGVIDRDTIILKPQISMRMSRMT